MQFLFRLLRMANMLKVASALVTELEKRVGMQFEWATLADLHNPRKISAAEAFEGSFSVELIPRDSPMSPFYDPSETPFHRVGKAVRRSIARVRGLRSNDAGGPSADISRIDGEYLMNITIGSPPVGIMALADTGSSLIWTQCQPCDVCYPQCRVLEQSFCPKQGSTCQYSVSYGDKSYSKGNISTDVFGFGSTSGSPFTLSGMVFGCGFNNYGLFGIHSTGIVGLGGGDASLISQIGGSSGTKFSYCLVPFFSTTKTTSKLSIGRDAEVIGPGTFTTPLIPNSPKIYYYLTLEGISINGEKFEVSGSSGKGADPGNMIIDSGTTLTWLPSDLYQQIEPAVSAAIDLPRAKEIINPFKLCYTSSGVLRGAPSIMVHFTDADVVLNWYNAFLQITENIICFSFVPTNGQAIYGNLAQMDFLIGYDLTIGTLSLQPADCTAH
ncbi:hypothetical protein MLD38_037410 [Melastoma candidum]|uniref:Uncharacterized protein n=1 Tax=Melastoma candidum TaxID=119954 RepID=A0ACB9LMY8_9MYRT|nr:hypothetical protein MLD38_037410 [Melastoma candidum]